MQQGLGIRCSILLSYGVAWGQTIKPVWKIKRLSAGWRCSCCLCRTRL